MPDDRLFHLALGHSEKVNRLTDFERGVWFVYKLASDDFGVMRFSATPLQDAALWLEKKPAKAVLRALETLCEVGLIARFTHQGQTYVYQADWQTWQKITYPRPTKQPAPNAAALDINTAWLFAHHPEGGRLPSWQDPSLVTEKSGKRTGKNREDFSNSPSLVRGTYTNTTTTTSTKTNTDDEIGERAGRFVNEVYPELYAKYRKGARYVSKPALDFQEALQLCRTWDDERLVKIATVFLTTDHEFAEKGSRTMAQFRSLASWCDSRLAERGIA